MADYTDEHRILLQGIMSHRIVTFKEVIKLIEIAKKRCGAEMPSGLEEKKRLIGRMMFAINKELEVVNMAIVKINDEDTASAISYYVFVNRMDRSEDTNQLTKKAMVDFQPHDLEYIKLLVEAIVSNEDRQIDQTSALNLALEVKTRSMKTNEAEHLLDRLVEDKWVRMAEDNSTVRLAPRFVAEMEPYLLEVHDDVLKKCHQCKKLVVKAMICPRCSTHQHLSCLGENSSCRSCKEVIKIKQKKKAGPGQNQKKVVRKRSARAFDDSSDDDD